VVLALGVGALLVDTPLASAHPTLLFTDPVSDEAVPTSPTVITLVFNEPVTIGPRAITLTDTAGRAAPLSPATLAHHGHAVTARVLSRLTAGTYLVHWQATGTDGDLVDEQFRFAVGAGIGAALTDADTSAGWAISWASVAARWVLFAGLAGALGGVIGQRWTTSARRENPRLPRIAAPVTAAAGIGALAVVALAAVLVAQDGPVSLWQEPAGLLLVVEAGGLLVAGGLARRRPARLPEGWVAAPLVAVLLAEGLRAHPNTTAPGWGAALTVVHLAGAAIWVGALAHVARTMWVWRAQPAAARWVLAGYVRLAGWAFALVIATGLLTAILLVAPPALVSTVYGRILLIKLALVAAAAALAYSGRRAWRTDRLEPLRARARLEAATLVAVLAASALLTATPPPSNARSSPPPAPRGPAIPIGTLAGQIGVAVTASAGQLVVRLSTPHRGDYYTPAPPQDYTLAGGLAHPTGTATGLTLRGCGEGCFLAPAGWASGDNVLTLRAGASGWRGGTISLLIPWPPHPGADQLARTAHIMSTLAQFTVYETVTSDTTAPAPVVNQLPMTGAYFLSQEPYATGIAPIATQISPPGRPIRLALGYPAATTNATLTLDPAGRISEETLTDPTHLIHRRFAYHDHN
jgi:copper transport protein